jgi:putative endonuclease
MAEVNWFVYIIEASDQSLYTGITTDPERRFKEHGSGPLGAKYFKGRKPVRILYREVCQNRSFASIREAQIKKLNRTQKLQLIEAHVDVSG